MMDRTKLHIELNDDQLKALGSVTVCFNKLEFYISMFVWNLISNDTVAGQIITPQLSFRKLVDIWEALYRSKYSDERQIHEFDELKKKVQAAASTRNRLVHANWVPTEQANVVERFQLNSRTKFGLVVQSEVFSTESLEATAFQIQNVTFETLRLMNRVIK